MDIGKYLVKARKNKGLSQEDVANSLNVSRQSVSLWECDQTIPTLDNLLCLSNLYDVSIAVLTGQEEFENKNVINNEEERLKIETLIAVHYAIECDEIRYDIKREFMIGSFLLLLGIIIMVISYIVRQYTSLVGEIIQIISWAFIWESALRFFLQNTANYRERIKYKELYRMARLKRNETLNQKK